MPMPAIMIVEFNDLRPPLCLAYCIPTAVLTPEQTATLLAADRRMYSDETHELAKDGLCERDPVHEAMEVIIQVRDCIIAAPGGEIPGNVDVVDKVTFAYLNERAWLRHSLLPAQNSG